MGPETRVGVKGGRGGHTVSAREAGESRRPSAVVPVLALVAVALLLVGPTGFAAAQPRSSDSTTVLAITQTPYITEQGTLTVSMQVSSPADIHLAYFTFCQITNNICYSPIEMTLGANNWYVGTTNKLSTYYEMSEGVVSGYNITIVFNDNTTLIEPTIPNPFTNLSIVTTVTSEYMFGVTVKPAVFGLSGVVKDAVTGAPLAGATVSLSPGDNSTTTSSAGAYSFSMLVNGTYTVAVTREGYRNASDSVTIAGGDAVKDLTLTNATQSTPVGSGGGGSTTYFGLTPTELAIPIVVVVVLVAVAVFLVRRRRSPSSSSPPVTEPATQGER